MQVPPPRVLSERAVQSIVDQARIRAGKALRFTRVALNKLDLLTAKADAAAARLEKFRRRTS
jgi:hypothetical protein